MGGRLLATCVYVTLSVDILTLYSSSSRALSVQFSVTPPQGVAVAVRPVGGDKVATGVGVGVGVGVNVAVAVGVGEGVPAGVVALATVE